MLAYFFSNNGVLVPLRVVLTVGHSTDRDLFHTEKVDRIRFTIFLLGDFPNIS